MPRAALHASGVKIDINFPNTPVLTLPGYHYIYSEIILIPVSAMSMFVASTNSRHSRHFRFGKSASNGLILRHESVFGGAYSNTLVRIHRIKSFVARCAAGVQPAADNIEHACENCIYTGLHPIKTFAT